MQKCKQVYTLGGLEFTSKAAIQRWISQNLLNSYPEFQSLSPDHHSFALDLLSRHPWADQKIGAGVLRFYVAPVHPYRTKGLFLERVDGTTTDFSTIQCLNPPNHIADFKSACRFAVMNQVASFKRVFFETTPEPTCPLLGLPLDPSNSHVDHTAPDTFEAILARFVTEFGVEPAQAVSQEHTDGCATNHLADPELERQWQDFHRANARLRVISSRANLSTAKTTLRKPQEPLQEPATVEPRGIIRDPWNQPKRGYTPSEIFQWDDNPNWN